MKIKKITQTNLSKLTRATGKQRYIIEEGSLGFGIRVSRNGHAVYVVRRKCCGQTKDYNLARVQELSPREARDKANELILTIKSAQNSTKTVVLKAENHNTIQNVFDEYYAKLCVEYNQTYITSDCNLQRARNFKNHAHPAKILRFFHAFILHFGATFLISDLKPITISQYYEKRSLEAKSVANKEMAYLRRVLNEEIKNGRLERNPISALKIKKEFPNKAGLPLHRLEEFYRHLDDWANCPEGTWTRKQVVLAVRFAINTGLRIGEVRSLQWFDTDDNNYVDTKERVAVLRFSKTSLTKGIRYVPLLDPAISILGEVPKHPSNKFIFASNKSTISVSERSMRSAFNYAKHKLKLSNALDSQITLYCTRHTFTDMMIIEYGADIATVSQVLGHSDTRLLEQRYLTKGLHYAASLRSKLNHLIS